MTVAAASVADVDQNSERVEQPARYHGHADAAGRAWADLCQMLLASNAFLYVE